MPQFVLLYHPKIRHVLRHSTALFLVFFISLSGNLIWGQARSVLITNSLNQKIAEAALITAQKKVFFSDSFGYASVDLKNQDFPLLIVAEGYNTRQISQRQDFTTQVVLQKKLLRAALDADSVMSLLAAARGGITSPRGPYQSLTYEKQVAWIDQILFNIWPISGLATPADYDIGKAYAAEVLKRNFYQDRFTYKETVLAKKEAGRVAAENWIHLPTHAVHLWQEKNYFNDVLNRGFYGPLSSQGRAYYQFQVKGFYFLGKEKVYRILFKPQKEDVPLFEGTADVLASTGLPLQAQYCNARPSILESYDSIGVNQLYGKTADRYFLVKQKNYFQAKHVGFHYAYEIDQFHLNFAFKDTISPLPNPAEVYSIYASDYEPNLKLWDSLAPAGLAPYDSAFFNEKNLGKAPPKWRFYEGSRLHRHVLNYYNWTYKSHFKRFGDFFVKMPAAYRALGYNAVEGLYGDFSLPFGLTYPAKEWELTPTLRYGLADKTFKPSLNLSYRFNPNNPQVASLSGGQRYQQFNSDEPVLPVINTIYALGLGENLIRLYAKNFLRAGYEFEATNGFSVKSYLEYAQRFPLFNNTSYSLLNPNSDFAPNNPTFEGAINENGFTPHQAFTFGLEIGYQIGQLYEHRYSQRYQHKLGFKQNLVIQKPRLYYNLKIGLPTQFGETDFWFQSLGVHQAFRVGNIGISQYDISLGHFPINENIPFVDYKHFDGIQVFFLQPTPSPKNRIKQFSTLPYYGFSTNRSYIEAHYEHFFEGTLFSKVGFLKRSGIHTLAGTSALAIADGQSFGEVFLGFNNIFDLVRIEYSVGYSTNEQLLQNIRINVDINYRYYQNNRPEKRPN